MIISLISVIPCPTVRTSVKCFLRDCLSYLRLWWSRKCCQWNSFFSRSLLNNEWLITILCIIGVSAATDKKRFGPLVRKKAKRNRNCFNSVLSFHSLRFEGLEKNLWNPSNTREISGMVREKDKRKEIEGYLELKGPTNDYRLKV